MRKSESSQSQTRLISVSLPRRLTTRHLTGLSSRPEWETYNSAADVQEDHLHHEHDTLQQSGLDAVTPVQPEPVDQKADQEINQGMERHAASMKNDRDDSMENDRETQLMNLYREINRVTSQRVRARQSRKALTYKREDESELRVQFMRHLNSFFANLDHPEAERLLAGYGRLQAATDQYLTLENSYHQEEDKLEEQEYRLSLSLESLFPSSDRGPTPQLPSHSGPWSSDPDEDRASTILTLPNCVSTYLARIGDERVLTERLRELDLEWYVTRNRKAERNRIGMALDEESEEFLATFDEERATLWKELNNAQMDVNSLRLMCLEQQYTGFDYEDLHDLHPHSHLGQPMPEPESDPLSLPAWQQSVFMDDTEPTDDEYDNEPPELIWGNTPMPSPGRRLRVSHFLSETPSLRATERINKWLLHNLRVSFLEIRRIHRSPLLQPLRQQGYKDKNISNLILGAWFADEMARRPSQHDPSLDDYDTVAVVADGQETRDRVRVRSSSLPSSVFSSPHPHPHPPVKEFQFVLRRHNSRT
ncbi:uncharacterized protein BDV14DRAFT_179368 [Aspergillus stella-maris]|uniref:uncharacterized protein n=1 Tax=Aspergillus stella-maris TaxID=1810926 RepID=UPI003CCDD8ED